MPTDEAGDRGLTRNSAVIALALAALVAAGVAGVTIAAPNAPAGDAILNDTADRYESAESVVGAATVTVENDTATREYEVSFAATDGNESRVSVTGDNGTYVFGTNGTVAWVHDEATGLTQVYDEADAEENSEERRAAWEENSSWDASDRAALYDWSRENATAERIGTETVDGTEAYVVRVTPADDTEGELTVWVTTDDSTVVRQELTGPNGTVVVDVTRTEFDASVADSTFQPPTDDAATAGETVESLDALRETTELTLPAVSDDRFAFDRGSTLAYGESVVAVQQYTGPVDLTVVTTDSDGESTALGGEAENVTETTVADTTVSVAETDRGLAVWWTEGDTRYGVVADTDRETLLAVAADLIEG